MKSLNAEANLISMSIHEEMNKNNCSIGSHPNFKFITILLFYICISVRVPPDKQNQQEVYIKNTLQDIGLQNCGDCQTNSEIYRTGCQEGQTRTLWDELKFLSTGGISSCSGKPQLCSQALSTDQIQDYPDYLG